MTSSTYSVDVNIHEAIQYNNDLKIIRSKNDDMFQCQSIMMCLGYNSKKYTYVNQYFDLKGTKELIDEIMKNYYLLKIEEVNETRNNLSKELRGTYIHRLLINHFASWYSPKYSYKIQLILDNIFIKEINELKDIIDLKNDIIFHNSVRTNINNKKILIIKKNDDDYKVSCNSTTKSKKKLGGDIVDTYTFPGGINIRQTIRNHFEKDGQTPKFKEEELTSLKEYINQLEPK
jgi:hypothetical protein